MPCKSLFLTLAIFVFPLAAAHALSLTVEGPASERTGIFGDAIDSAFANGGILNAKDVSKGFGGSWTSEGNLSSGLSNDLLSITFSKGGWGATEVAGTWTINPGFWTLYGDAVIGWRVESGGGNPDIFMFEIKPGVTTGTWSYKLNSGDGGKLANMQLFGSSLPRNMPDGGTTVALIGLGISGVALTLRYGKKN